MNKRVFDKIENIAMICIVSIIPIIILSLCIGGIFVIYTDYHDTVCVDGILKKKHNGSSYVYYGVILQDGHQIPCQVKK